MHASENTHSYHSRSLVTLHTENNMFMLLFLGLSVFDIDLLEERMRACSLPLCLQSVPPAVLAYFDPSVIRVSVTICGYYAGSSSISFLVLYFAL